jgi:hypothetical protein
METMSEWVDAYLGATVALSVILLIALWWYRKL